MNSLSLEMLGQGEQPVQRHRDKLELSARDGKVGACTTRESLQGKANWMTLR